MDLTAVKAELSSYRVRVLTGSGLLMLLVHAASAGALNTSISDILIAVSTIFQPLVNLIIAVVPVIIVLAVVSLIGGILSGVLGKMKGKF
jgi:hypothetical protein